MKFKDNCVAARPRAHYGYFNRLSFKPFYTITKDWGNYIICFGFRIVISLSKIIAEFNSLFMSALLHLKY